MLFDVFEVQGAIEVPIAQGLEAHNPFGALGMAVGRLLPEGFTLHGVRNVDSAGTAVARVRSKHGGPCREFTVYPARRPNP